jgi:PHD/YefM family antitoxin component YafN of YafNO toxin-antitoxin module
LRTWLFRLLVIMPGPGVLMEGIAEDLMQNGTLRDPTCPHEDDEPNARGIAVKTVTWTENASWDDVLRQAGQEDVLVLRDGHPVVLMTPFDEDDLAWYARERDPGFLESLAKARHQVNQGKTVSHEDLKRELGLD